MRFKFILISSTLVLAAAACTKDSLPSVHPDGQMLELSFTASIDDGALTRTTYDATNHVGLWKREDMAGVIASYGSSFTDPRMQNFSISSKNRGKDELLSSATFSGKLTDMGAQTYTYHAVYPYTAFQTVTDASAVGSRLEERQFPDLRSWDGACDMLASKPLTVSSASVAAEGLEFRFTRLFGMLRLRFGSSILDTYGSETVETISIESADPSDVLAGKFTVDLSSDEAPDPVMSTVSGERFSKVTLDYRCKNATLADIDAYFVLCPGEYDEVTITVKTSAHTLTLPRTGLSVSRGCIASATMNWKGGDNASGATSLLPKNPSTLKILTFGHSYVVNSMEYMDELLNNAGIKNVTFANFYIGNCSLEEYWDHVNNAGNTEGGTDVIPLYKRYYDGTKVTDGSYPAKTVIDALCDEPWDVVVFQTNTEKLGYYDDFASYLDKMIDYVKTTCQEKHGKTPVLAWHMFWAYGSLSPYVRNNYYGSQELNYAAHVQTAKQIMRNTDIQLVIPTGTAIQSLRRSSVNNPYIGGAAYEFLKDGKGISHMDSKAGCYTCACTWFEFFMKPCFGISVLGDTFTPNNGYSGVSVTSENRGMLHKAAILACQHPFEISHLDEIPPMDITGTTEKVGTAEASDGDSKNDSTEPFKLKDNLTW